MLTLEDLSRLASDHAPALDAKVAAFDLGGRRFDGNVSPALMGAINLSADSWYRESVCLSADAAIERGRILAAQGATILDIGAESTLSHAAEVGAAAQQSQLLPVVRELSRSGLIVSVETYHPSVTRACFEAGARVLNLTGTEQTDELFRMVADFDGALACFGVRALPYRMLDLCRLYPPDILDMLHDFIKHWTWREIGNVQTHHAWIDARSASVWYDLARLVVRPDSLPMDRLELGKAKKGPKCSPWASVPTLRKMGAFTERRSQRQAWSGPAPAGA